MNELKSKTMLFALALSIFGVLQASLGLFTEYLDPFTYGVATTVIGIVVGVLRVLTTVPLKDK